MAEIAEIPQNGRIVVSTFSGTGGSCLGFRWAGFRTVWASEFIEAARESYRANFPDVPLDERDIRDVSGSDILATIGRERGDVDVMEGSPPCASFSLAGARAKLWGEKKKYSETEQRVDDLFFEYARIIDEVRPRAFVGENVAGLLRGTARGYFNEILAALRAPGYRVGAKLLDAQWLGVPQARQRLIFVGVRDDLDVEPPFPTPLPYRYTIRDAIGDVGSLRQDRTTSTIRSGEPVVQRSLDEPLPTVTTYGVGPDQVCDWTVEDQGQRIDLDDYAIGKEYDRLREGEHSQRYLNLTRAHRDEASPTITAEGGNVGAAAVVHPTQRRKFTIAELRRLSGFPDDFVLTGRFRQQWERVGRAVPPPMMRSVADALYEGVFARLP